MMTSAQQNPLPTLFISHGSPELGNDPGITGERLRRLGQGLTQQWEEGKLLKPRAVLVISPHWSTRGLAVSTSRQQQAWHDFGGFAPDLYTLEYSPKGSLEVAQEIVLQLKAAEISVHEDVQRPLDHGAWVPLRYIFPDAQIPVLQLSLQPFASPAQQFALGQALASLRYPVQSKDGSWQGGVLILASGGFTHNLQEAFGMMQQRVPQHAPIEQSREQLEHVAAFRTWILNAMNKAASDYSSSGVSAFEELFDYRERAPHAHRAHPTDEHFLPLYIALGAGATLNPHAMQISHINDEITYGGILALDSFAFQ